MNVDLTNRIAIVTGAGGGLGRAHALLLARHGAKVVVNDLGGARDGSGGSLSAAQAVVNEIVSAGGEAVANGASVTDVGQVNAMIEDTVSRWGRIDILVNNAGILRDRTFAKLDLDDFRAVVEVHLMGSVNCTKAVWDLMRAQQYGRVIFTTSSSGLYGNFGQSHYSAAKLGLVGLMKTLQIEGERYGIHVNCLSPSAATRMTEDIMTPEQLALLVPANVAPAVVSLASSEAPKGAILCAGAGSYERAYVTLTRGEVLGAGDQAPAEILRQWDAISDRTDEQIPEAGPLQARWEMERASSTAIA